MQTTQSHAVGIVGARGYSGLELARILLQHPVARLKACFATDSKWSLSDYLPENAAAEVPVESTVSLDRLAPSFKTVFLATPAEVSAELAPGLLAKGVNVIDLSGAYRLNASLSEKWYKLKHDQSLLSRAEYGLVPWSGALSSGTSARLISNPGCYATAVLMAAIPLVKEGVIETSSLVIDAKSGTSGAGRKAVENFLFTEVDGECLPYRVGKHQHLPEICEYTERFAGAKIDPHFTTSLLATRRGIIAGLYARLTPAIAQKSPAERLAAVESAFAKHYSGYPLVKVGAVEHPGLLSLKRVVGSARTHISFAIEDGNKLYAFSTIDNLLKGAASQAVENFNRLADAPVTTGLTNLEGVL